jgi:hypothetical protein
VKTTGTEKTNEPTEKRDIPQGKYERTPERIPYYELEKIYQRVKRKDQHKQQFNEDGEVIHSIDDDFHQPSDEDAQGNVLMKEERALVTMNCSHRTPNKEDTKPAAKLENQEIHLSPEQNQKILRKQ